MADLRIVDAPLLSTVKGTEKIPTGGEGNFSISVNQVADFAKLKWVLATEEYVVNAVGNVQADLNLHKNNKSNPHNVTKTQVGLGNVDNTADLDKPLSNATQSAIITANSGKADKSYVDSQDQLKADKNTVEASLLLKADKNYVDSQDQLKADISYVDSAVGALSTDASKQYATLALATADIANIALNKNIFVSEAANGGYWYKATAVATTLTKSPYDPLTHAKADATTKANAAEANAKAYADSNKLDLKKINHSYQNGNLIGQKSARYLNFGVTSGLTLRAENYYDSVVIPVDAGDVLFILNDKQSYAAGNGGAYAFFAEEPYLNRSQTRIADNRSSLLVDPETGLSYIRISVPVGAKYLILNTRYNDASGTISNVFNWAIHSSAFSSSYAQGTEVINYIDDVKLPTVVDLKKLSDEKLDLKSIKYSYRDGNKIGSKSDKATNFGLNGSRVLSASSAVDSVSVPVNEKAKLVVFNDKDTFNHSVQAVYAFFAKDPLINRTQVRIVHASVAKTDEVSGTAYHEVIVPDGAKYLLLNTRFTSGGVPTLYNWAVHENFFSSSYTQGHEYISKIENSSTEKYPSLHDNTPLKSRKNLYVGNSIPQVQVNDNGASKSSNYDDVLSPFIPVEFGKTYTISGLSSSKMGNGTVRILGFINPTIPSTAVKLLGTVRDDSKITITIDDPNILYIAFPIITSGFGTAAEADNLAVQVEVGDTVTAYEPAYHTKAILKLSSKIEEVSTEKSPLLYDNAPLKSRKNLYVGNSIPQVAVNDNGASKSANYDDVLSPFIPVEFGKTYTISGMSAAKMGNNVVRVVGFTNPTIPSAAVKLLGTVRGDSKITITIDNSSILYIAFPLIRSGFGSALEADNLAIQVEVGATATTYEPAYHTKSILKLVSRIDEANISSNLNLVSQFTQMDVVRDPSLSVLTPISKTVGPYGLNYKLSGASNIGNASNNLYGQMSFNTAGKKAINVNLMQRVNGERAKGVLKRTAFNVPSGCLDNPDSFPYVEKYPKTLYVHPSIAYTDTPIAGFKYWMFSSAFPPTSDGGVLWEDEDLFVSNDAENWQRVRSMYETDKSYTTATLRLPPQTLVTNNARKHCFLPSLAIGDSIEVSVPDSNGMPAMDRVTITLDQQNPWKHDPFIMIDGGYVYTYHSFHLPTQERTGGKNRFIVCVRTNNGIDWDVVRSDGSTMRITEATSRQLFTKDAQGRYNFIYYGYGLSGSNPEIIKFGEGDYEFFYGSNFAVKFTGSTPYTFDFSNRIPIQTKAAGNHPTIFNDDGVLYLITNTGFYRSENRGVSWTDLPNYPMWLGGVAGMSYKKSTCKGEGGKFLLLDVQRCVAPSYSLSTFNYINDVNNLFIYEYTSFSDFLDKANNGLVDAYIDLQVTKANPIKSSREVIQLPCITANQISGTGLEMTQRLKVADIEVDVGDIVHLHVTLNSRKGAEIIFGGIDIS